MLCYIAVCPVPIAEKLLALLKAGRLSIVNGVSYVNLDEDAKAYTITHQYGTERAEVLVNTTGSVDRYIQKDTQPKLIKSLRENGLIEAYQREGMVTKGAAVDLKIYKLPKTKI